MLPIWDNTILEEGDDDDCTLSGYAFKQKVIADVEIKVDEKEKRFFATHKMARVILVISMGIVLRRGALRRRNCAMCYWVSNTCVTCSLIVTYCATLGVASGTFVFNPN